MGLLVDKIVDIVQTTVNIETTGTQKGILGAAIVDGKATEVINTCFYLQRAHADWFAAGQQADPAGRARVLLVEESAFFRELIVPVLQAAGYDMLSSPGGPMR